jgi:glycosyltransferase involved in cell wall biosynthesis
VIRVGVDASNLRGGGGITHLTALLRAADPDLDGFDEIVVWAGRKTLQALPQRPWLRAAHDALLDGGVARRVLWQQARLGRAAREAAIDVLFVPGGSYRGAFRPFVTMCRNLLPFERAERRRYGASVTHLRLALLERVQASTFANAGGTIFLTEYAKRAVLAVTGPLRGRIALIPHGVSEELRLAPRPQMPLAAYTAERPFRLLYVSVIDVYKSQCAVAEAVAELRRRGVAVTIDFVGPAYGPALLRLRETLRRLDPGGEAIRYRGAAAGRDLVAEYHAADGFVFASTCENMPNILLEAMAAGLPIACSDRGPMPEIAGDGAVFFDPDDAASIAEALAAMLGDEALRARVAARAYERAAAFSWPACARATFAFLRDIVDESALRSRVAGA